MAEMRPLKVKIYLSRPAILSRLLTLDKLIAAVLFGRGKKNKIYDRGAISEILKEKDGVFCSSIFFVETPVIYMSHNMTASPKLSRRYYRDMLPKPPSKEIWHGTGSGIWKTSFTTFVSFYADYIYFYANADKEKLYGVLSKVRGVGKKTQFGHGAVRGVEIEETGRDKSLFLNETTPARPLSVTWGVKTDRIALYTVNGATWDKSGLEPCVIPPLSLKEGVIRPAEPEYELETISSTHFTAIHHEGIFDNISKKKQKDLKFIENRNSERCVACGIVADRIVRFEKGAKTITQIASDSFTDYRIFSHYRAGDCLCEYCAKAIASSYTTRTHTIITKDAIIRSDKAKNTNAFAELLKERPDGQYVYLHHAGMQKHILVGSTPSISRKIVVVNQPDHNIYLLDTEITDKMLEVLQAYPQFKNAEYTPKRSKPDETLAWQEYCMMTNPEHVNILKYLPKDHLADFKEVGT